MPEIHQTLADRGKEYGDFDEGIRVISNILTLLSYHHKLETGYDLSTYDQVNFTHILIKLVRLAASPEHVDSWHDLAGYATLIENVFREKHEDEKIEYPA